MEKEKNEEIEEKEEEDESKEQITLNTFKLTKQKSFQLYYNKINIS